MSNEGRNAMLSIKLSDFSEVRKSSGEFLWCRFSMLFVLIQIYQSETFYSSSIEISYRCSGFQVEVTARGTLWWSVYFHSIFFFFSYYNPGNTDRREIWKSGQKESNHTSLEKKFILRPKMNIIKNFITPELSSHLAKELTDTISISLTRSSFPLPFFLIIANIFQLNLWSCQWWCGWFITKALFIFFLLKLSGGILELWIERLIHSYFWSNNSISRDLYKWNKLIMCAKIAIKYPFHHHLK